MTGAKRKVKLKCSQDQLNACAYIQVRFENGRTEVFEIAAETRVPSDMTLLISALRSSPSRTAFWMSQTERALDEVRRQEVRIDELIGSKFIDYQYAYINRQGPTTDRTVHESVNSDKEVVLARLKLVALRKQYGLLRGLYKSVEHRGFVLDRLVAREVK